MEYNPLESANQKLEGAPTEKELLQQQLIVERARLEDMKARAGEFYDEELIDAYSEVMVGVVPHLRKLYLEAKTNRSFAEAEENYKKYQAFNQQQLEPIRQVIIEIQQKLSAIAYADKKRETEQKNKAAAEQFVTDKNTLEEKLFDALEAIHIQIPQVARDAGMNTEAAMKTYLPNQIYRASQIEGYMADLEQVQDARDLIRVQEQIDREGLFK